MSRNDDPNDDPYVVIEKTGGSIAPFLVGLAVGAGLALLFAPQSGAETRRFIRRRARRAGEQMRTAAEDLGDDVRDKVDHLKHRVEDSIDHVRDTVQREKRHAKDAVRTGRDAARAAREELESRLSDTKANVRATAEAIRSARRTTATAGDDLDDDTGV